MYSIRRAIKKNPEICPVPVSFDKKKAGRRCHLGCFFCHIKVSSFSTHSTLNSLNKIFVEQINKKMFRQTLLVQEVFHKNGISNVLLMLI
jgi:hypothetical protein